MDAYKILREKLYSFYLIAVLNFLSEDLIHSVSFENVIMVNTTENK